MCVTAGYYYTHSQRGIAMLEFIRSLGYAEKFLIVFSILAMFKWIIIPGIKRLIP